MYRPSPTRPVRGKRAREMRPDTHFEPHEHAWAQIAYCVSGTLQVSVQDVRADHDVSYVVPSSRAVWIAPRSRHTVAVLSWAELHTLYVDPGAAPSGWQASRMFAVSPLLRELIVALERVEPGPREAHLAALTLLELRSAEAAPLGVPLPRAEGGDKRLRALCEAVLHAPAERATLADWAGAWAPANARRRACSATSWARPTPTGGARWCWRTPCRCWRAACRWARWPRLVATPAKAPLVRW